MDLDDFLIGYVELAHELGFELLGEEEVGLGGPVLLDFGLEDVVVGGVDFELEVEDGEDEGGDFLEVAEVEVLVGADGLRELGVGIDLVELLGDPAHAGDLDIVAVPELVVLSEEVVVLVLAELEELPEVLLGEVAELGVGVEVELGDVVGEDGVEEVGELVVLLVEADGGEAEEAREEVGVEVGRAVDDGEQDVVEEHVEVAGDLLDHGARDY